LSFLFTAMLIDHYLFYYSKFVLWYWPTSACLRQIEVND
jgi:hypothetical protein